MYTKHQKEFNQQPNHKQKEFNQQPNHKLRAQPQVSSKQCRASAWSQLYTAKTRGMHMHARVIMYYACMYIGSEYRIAEQSSV